ncbi:MAG: lysophospholipid acyltransferase family protein [Burkholderiaceae bacterium]
MGWLLIPWRLLRVLRRVLQGIWINATRLPHVDAPTRDAIVQRWATQLLRDIGVQVRVSGTLHPGPVLLVANHVSWLDIPTLHASAPQTRFVSKSAIAHWPLVGTLARAGGTLFIERERKRDALRVVHEVAGALRERSTVAVFPEGTTGPGDVVLPFHANLLQAAIATATPVQPVVLRYSQPGHRFSRAAQYLGGTTLVGSLVRVIGARGIVVHVDVLPVEPAGEQERRAHPATLRARVEQGLAASAARG